MPLSFGAGVRDGLSNLTASLGAGKDKAAHDAFFVFDLADARGQGRCRDSAEPAEHLGSADTTAQLSARFASAAAVKSIGNLLLLGDGESWARQTIDFGGLPEMVRTFLQVAAGAADIPVTRLLGQSPAGLSATRSRRR